MKKRMKTVVIGLGVFTLVNFGLGAFFDSQCKTSCVGEAFGVNAEAGIKELEKRFNIIFDDNDDIVINGNGRNIHISSDGEQLGGDEDNPARKKDPLTESYASKGIKELEIKSYITDWKVVESPDDRFHFVFKGYLPPKEWAVSEDGDSLKLEVRKKGPLEGELQLPKNFKGELQFVNISGDIMVDHLAQVESFDLTSVSGDITVKASPTLELDIKTVSGDVVFTPAAVGKDLEFEYKGVSADLNVSLPTSIKEFEAQTVSGDVKMKAGKTVGFTYEMEGVSASFDGLPTGGRKSEGFGRRGAEGSFGQDPKGKLSFKSVSGDFNLELAP